MGWLVSQELLQIKFCCVQPLGWGVDLQQLLYPCWDSRQKGGWTFVCLFLFYFWKVNRGRNRIDLEDGGDRAKEWEISAICVWEGVESEIPLLVAADSYSRGDLVAKSCLTLATPRTVACQAPLCMGFSRQEHWSGETFASPGDLPNPGIKPGPPALQADS